MKRSVGRIFILLIMIALMIGALVACNNDKTQHVHSFGEWQTITEPSCSAEGLQRRECSGCDEFEEKKIDKLEHTPVIDEAVEATCTTPGKTQGSHCDVCNSPITPQQPIDPLGHNYVMTWTSDDNLHALVVLTCQNDNQHVQKMDGTVVTERDEPTCEQNGEIRYTVTVNYEEKTYSDTHTKPIDKLNHNYSIPQWTWNEDKTSATLKLLCANDNGHFVEPEVSMSHKDESNECAVETTYTATANYEGTPYTSSQTVTKEGKHSYGTPTWTWDDNHTKATAHFVCEKNHEHTLDVDDNEIEKQEQAADCINNGKITYTASVEVYGQPYPTTFEETIIGSHKYEDEPEWEWTEDYTKATAKFTCSVCHKDTQEVETSEITNIETPATCDDGGSIVYTAKARFNDKDYTNMTTKVLDALGHKYRVDKWNWAENHESATVDLVCEHNEAHKTQQQAQVQTERQEANCTDDGSITYTATVRYNEQDFSDTQQETILAAHTFGEWEQTQDPDCTNAGKKQKKCSVCGELYGEEETVDALKHNFDVDWSYDDQNHWHKCSRCEEEDQHIPHSLNGLGECETCDYIATTPVDEFEFTLKDDSYYELTNYNGDRTNVVIPSEYLDKPVKSIYAQAFYEYTKLTSVRISEGIETIGNQAFEGCTNLKTVYVASSVVNIGSNIFNYCNKIESITIPTIFIGQFTTTNLKTLVILNGDSIPAHAFESCENLVSITVPDTLKKIGARAFHNTAWYNNLNEGLVYIGKIVYSYKGKMAINAEINIASDTVGIAGEAFKDSTRIVSVTIPDSVKYIGKEAFSGCTNIQTATMSAHAISYIPQNNLQTVTITSGSIGNSAFSECASLQEVTIGSGVTSIGDRAFYGCISLATVNWNATNCTSVGKYESWSSDYTIFKGCTSLATVNVGNNVQAIPDYVFYNCTGLQEVTIGEGVTNIGDFAFSGCTNIQTAAMPALAISYIPMKSLKTVTITSGSIGNSAFSECASLQEVTIGEDVMSIGDLAFSGCTQLATVNWNATNCTSVGKYTGSSSSYYSSSDYTIFKGCTSLTTVNIGDIVQTIPEDAFYNCTGLQTVTIGAGVESIGEDAFYGCTNIKTATMPALAISSIPKRSLLTVTITRGRIGYDAFRYCTGLQTVTIGAGVESIGEDAFYNCTGLQEVTLGEGVTSIGDSAFYNCKNITKVNVTSLKTWCEIEFASASANPLYAVNYSQSDKAKLYVNNEVVAGDVEIPKGTTKIGNHAFYYLTNITSVTIPDSVTSIGDYAFYNCTSLATVNWNATNCTSVGKYTGSSSSYYSSYDYTIFQGCTSLATVNIGANVQSIPEYAFYGCTNITKVNVTSLKTWCEIEFEKATSGSYTYYYYYSNPLYVANYSQAGKAKLYLNNIEVTEVKDLDDLDSIPAYAFYGLTGITSVTIPDSVESIGDLAFSGCTALAIVNWNATNCTSGGFSDCTSLATVNIGANVQSIPEYAFEDCTSITKVNYLGDIKGWCEIEFAKTTDYGTYYYSNPLYVANYRQPEAKLYLNDKEVTEVKDLDGVTSIPAYAFYRLTGITSVTIPDSVTSIGSSAFSGCTNIQTATMPALAISYIPMKSLKTVTITSGEIRDRAFSGCTGLQTVTIGSGVTSIGDGAFDGCISLATVDWNATNCTEAGSYSLPIFEGCTSLATVNIRDDVQIIPHYAFCGCTGLTSITIPDSVTSIGESAFEGCTGLQEVTIGEGVTSIGSSAFYNCKNITKVNYLGDLKSWCEIEFGNIDANPLYVANYSYNAVGAKLYLKNVEVTGDVEIPQGITKIGEGAFYGLTGITSVTISESVRSVGNNAFGDCTNITKVNYLGDLKGWCEIEFGNWDANPLRAANEVKLYLNDEEVTGAVEIPQGTTKIGVCAFYGLTGITSVTIPDSVESIGEGAFYGCKNITKVNVTSLKAWCEIEFGMSYDYYSHPLHEANGKAKLYLNDNEVTGDIEIPQGTTKIGACAFYYLNITSVTIPDSVTSIGDDAFYGCKGLKSITIPDSVTIIGAAAFANCKQLATVNWNATNCTEAGRYHNSSSDYTIFKGCTSLKTVNIGENVQHIGENAFSGCTQLAIVNWNATNCTSVGKYEGYAKDYTIFKGCTSLTTVNIGNNVQSIPEDAFYGCWNIRKVNYLGDLKGWCEIEFASASANPLNGKAKLYVQESGAETEVTGAVEIPQGTTKIGAYAFYNLTDITSVTIPDSVTSIGDGAFYGCTGLQEVTIGKKVTSIGSSAFSGCTNITKVNVTSLKSWCEIEFGNDSANPLYVAKGNAKLYAVEQPIDLTNLNIPQGTTKIGNYAFYGLTEITSVTIPDSVENIGDYAFSSCIGLQEVTIGAGVTNIGREAFGGCTSLATVNWNATNCTSVGKYTGSSSSYDDATIFKGCTSLTAVNIGDNVQSIPSYAFYNCTNITKVNYLGDLKGWCEIEFGNAYANPLNGKTKLYVQESGAETEVTGAVEIPQGTTKIGIYAFYGLTGIISVTIPDSVTSIGDGAFYGCTGLQEVTIGKKVTSIGSSAFSGCTNITKVNVTSLKSWCEIEFGNDSANPLYVAKGNAKLYLNDVEVKEVKDLDGLEAIPDYAFYGCTGITSVTIPDSVTSIGYSAFSGCTNIQTATMPANTISRIPKNSLTTVTITSGKIGDQAFYYCTGLQTVTIGEGVKSIGDRAFEGRTSLATVNWNATNCTSVGKYESWSSDYTIFKGCTSLATVNVGNNVQAIPSYVFYNCTGLQEVTIGENVTSIGWYAFYGCKGLKSITIPDSVTSIGYSAFYGCTALATVNWNATNCTTAGRYYNSSEDYTIFQGCTSLTTVNIGANVEMIPEYAFYNCTSITKVNYLGDLKGWCEIEFGNAYANPLYVANHYSYAVGAKLYLNDVEVTGAVEIPQGTTKIGYCAFYGLTGITSVTIPDSVTSIGRSAFEGCTGLQTVTIGTGVTSIGNSAFENCTGLTSITIPENVTSIGDGAFYGCTGLQEVTIGEGVTSIGDSAFYNCRNITKVNVTSLKAWCEIEFASASANPLYAGKANLYLNDVKVTEIKDLEGLQTIPAFAFYGLTGITSVTIPDNVISIGDWAFVLCKGLKSITIPDSVTIIGDLAFSGCTQLATVNWNATNCTEAGSSSYPIFKDCTSLTTVNIGANVQSIPSYAFYNCKNITKVNVTSLKTWCEIEFASASANPLYAANDSQAGKAKLYLNDVVVTEVKDLDGLTSIPYYAFYGLTGITSVIIPESVTSIGDDAFSTCTGLQTVTIGAGVESIGDLAFSGCTALAIVNWNATNCTSVGKYEGYAKDYTIFKGCTSLTTVNIGNNVQTIPEDTFWGCTGLTSITIPENVTSIGKYAFYGCTGLQTVTIGQNVTSIDDRAFYGCRLQTVYYGGDAQQWSTISIGSYNGNLDTAQRYYYSADPNYDGAHWHYNEQTHMPEVWSDEN